MFWKKDTKEKEGLIREINRLKKEKVELNETVERLKLDRKISEEDIKHMIRMKEKRLELEFKEKSMDILADKAEAIAQAKAMYQDKLIQNVEGQKGDIKEMYGQILERLPNIGVKLKGDV